MYWNGDRLLDEFRGRSNLLSFKICGMMKKLKFVSWIFLACFRVFVPMEVSGQSMVLIERDTFRMYSNPLNADSTLATKVYDRVYSPPYIRDVSAYYGWWRLQGWDLSDRKDPEIPRPVIAHGHKEGKGSPGYTGKRCGDLWGCEAGIGIK